MNQETNDFLKENLEEAHLTFETIVAEMKTNLTFISDKEYNEIETNEMKCYQSIIEKVSKMNYYVMEYDELKDNNNEILYEEFKIYLKYACLYIVSFLYIRLFHEIYDTSKMNEMLKYFVGMFLGSTYMVLLNKDISDTRNSTKERRNLINKLKTMKEEYKSIHDEVVAKIDDMFKANSFLWSVLEEGKVKNK